MPNYIQTLPSTERCSKIYCRSSHKSYNYTSESLHHLVVLVTLNNSLYPLELVLHLISRSCNADIPQNQFNWNLNSVGDLQELNFAEAEILEGLEEGSHKLHSVLMEGFVFETRSLCLREIKCFITFIKLCGWNSGSFTVYGRLSIMLNQC